jgi:hypothetical protein
MLVWKLQVNAAILLVLHTLYSSGGFEWLHFPVLFVLNTRDLDFCVVSDASKREAFNQCNDSGTAIVMPSATNQ